MDWRRRRQYYGRNVGYWRNSVLLSYYHTFFHLIVHLPLQPCEPKSIPSSRMLPKVVRGLRAQGILLSLAFRSYYSYNPGTLSKLAVNYQAVKVALGQDYFQEFIPFFKVS